MIIIKIIIIILRKKFSFNKNHPIKLIQFNVCPHCHQIVVLLYINKKKSSDCSYFFNGVMLQQQAMFSSYSVSFTTTTTQVYIYLFILDKRHNSHSLGPKIMRIKDD